MSLEYNNPKLIFRMIAMEDNGDCMVFLCQDCLLKYGFRKDEIEQEEPQQCFVEDCSNKAEYGSYIEPEFIIGFQYHDLL